MKLDEKAWGDPAGKRRTKNGSFLIEDTLAARLKKQAIREEEYEYKQQ